MTLLAKERSPGPMGYLWGPSGLFDDQGRDGILVRSGLC